MIPVSLIQQFVISLDVSILVTECHVSHKSLLLNTKVCSILLIIRQVFLLLPAKYLVMTALMKSAWIWDCRNVFILCWASSLRSLLPFHFCKDTQQKNPNRWGLVLSITILFVFELRSTETRNYTETWLGFVMERRNREAFKIFFFPCRFSIKLSPQHCFENSKMPPCAHTNTLSGHQVGTHTTLRLSKKGKIISSQGCCCQIAVTSCKSCEEQQYRWFTAHRTWSLPISPVPLPSPSMPHILQP